MKSLLCSLLCLFALSCESPIRGEEHWLIGRFKISGSDVASRSQIVQIFYPQNTISDAGLIQLKNAYVLAAILENNGHVINDHKLSNESSRIEASSRDPKTLKKIKDVFTDQEAYLRVFILPSYVERTLSSVFQELPLHAETLQKAQSFYSSVLKDPRSIQKSAEKEKVDFGKLCLSPSEGFSFSKKGDEKKERTKENSIVDMSKVPNEKMRESVMSAMTDTNEALVSKWINEIVAPTASGAIVSKIVDYYSSWMVLRLVTKTKDSTCFEAAVFPKETLETWLETEKAKVSIRHVSK